MPVCNQIPYCNECSFNNCYFAGYSCKKTSVCASNFSQLHGIFDEYVAPNNKTTNPECPDWSAEGFGKEASSSWFVISICLMLLIFGLVVGFVASLIYKKKGRRSLDIEMEPVLNLQTRFGSRDLMKAT